MPCKPCPAKIKVSSRRILWLNLAVKIPGIIVWTLVLLLAGSETARAQRNAQEPKPAPMRLPPLDPNAPRWHTILVTPKPGLPKIHFYDKLNPVWWFGNADDPLPPDWYRPDDLRRKAKWYFRNPLHNFNFYVIGVADKNFYRSGKFPEHNSDPRGGWDFAVARRHILLLPFVSYDRDWCDFYFGWRERGNFGAKLNFHAKPKNRPGKAPPVEKFLTDTDSSTSDMFDR